MNEQPTFRPEQDGPTPGDGLSDDRPRLAPRPIETSPVDPGLAAVFGRPAGVQSAFAPRTGPTAANGLTSVTPPPSAALATAFSRPVGSDEVILQRPPGQTGGLDKATDATYWTGDDGRDPWRDPGSGVVVGAPAKTGTGEADEDRAAKPTGPLLSVPELLFGRRVKPSALVILLVAALLVGAVGGVTGWALGNGGSSLTDVGDTLTQSNAGTERAPDSVAGITARVAPAVVSLEVQAGTSGDVGSGVVIDPKGYILTNNHVIAAAAGGAGTITAVFSSGARVPATIVGRDPVTDLAVIKVDATNLTVIKLGTSGALKPGDPVIAIGSPLGLAGTVTSGIVSALNRPLLVPGENGGPSVVYDAIQTDAAINPGNSGGALVDATGALVGINSANQTFGGSDSGGGGGGSIGLGFAIPIDQAIKVAQSLIRTGTVKHAVLGVSTRDVSATASLGAQVDNVIAGGAAAAAGIAEGDVITKFGGRSISSSVELQVAVLDDQPGQTVTVQFARQGQQHTVQVTLTSD
ncbi:MAG TPA: trypsin-like peptidase domain-containing protein [Pseudonocardiaceae bacterium]|nr:trypsin-like peptidase domain-containing protein [Pseudonocardiaceae bacterium]